jgi:hypothetical protein
MTPNLTPKITPNSTPKLTPNSTAKKTPDSTPCFTTCHFLIQNEKHLMLDSLTTEEHFFKTRFF